MPALSSPWLQQLRSPLAALRFCKDGSHHIVVPLKKPPKRMSFHHFTIRTLPSPHQHHLVPICMSHSSLELPQDLLATQFSHTLELMDKAASAQNPAAPPPDLLAILINLLHSGADQEIPLYLLHWLDDSLSKHSWTLPQSLFVMDSLSLLMPDFFLRGKTFSKLLDLCASQSFQPHSLAMSLYFSSMVGRTSFNGAHFLTSLQHSLHLPSLTDWKIICYALTKLSLPLDSDKLLNNLYEQLASSFSSLSSFHIRLFSKVLEMSHFYHPDFFSLIKAYAQANMCNLRLSEIACYFSILNHYKLYENDLLFHIEERILTILGKFSLPCKDVNLFQDVTRILYCFSSLNYVPNYPNFFFVFTNFLAPCLIRKRPFSLYYIQSLHSLVMMGYFYRPLLFPLYTDYYLNRVTKGKSKQAFIHHSICIEANHLLPFKSPLRWIDKPGSCSRKELTKRPFLWDLKILATNYAGNEVPLKRVLSHIHLSGIIMKVTEEGEFLETIFRVPLETTIPAKDEEPLDTGVKLAIELLDSEVLLHNSEVLTGVMAAKLRQLKCLGFHILTLRPSEVTQLLNLETNQFKEKFQDLIKSAIHKKLFTFL